MAYHHDDDDAEWRDRDEFDLPPPGGEFESEDRNLLFVRACKTNERDIRTHRFEVRNCIRRLLELQMTGKRASSLLIDFRPQILATATFCNRLGSAWLKCAPLSPAWCAVFEPVRDADKYDPDAWFLRGYRVTLANLLTAANLLEQALTEAENITTSPDTYIPDWLREVYNLGDNGDIPF